MGCTSNGPPPISQPHLIGPHCKGFLVGGTRAGGNFSAVAAHFAKDAKLDPPLTGQYLSNPAVLSEEVVPEEYKAKYLPVEQNSEASIVSRATRDMSLGAYNPDRKPPLFVTLNH